MALGLVSSPPPPPQALTRANRFWSRGQKCRDTGSPCWDRHMSPGGTYHGTRVAGSEKRTVHDYKRVPNTPAYTPEHKSNRNYGYTNTPMDPSCSPHRATNHRLCWIDRKNEGSKEGPKEQKHGFAVFGDACVRTREGGVLSGGVGPLRCGSLPLQQFATLQPWNLLVRFTGPPLQHPTPLPQRKTSQHYAVQWSRLLWWSVHQKAHSTRPLQWSGTLWLWRPKRTVQNATQSSASHK